MTNFDTTADMPLTVVLVDEVAQFVTIPAAAAHQQLQGVARYGKSITGAIPRFYQEELARNAGGAVAEQQSRRVEQLLNVATTDHLTGTA